MELWCRPFWLRSTGMLLLLSATATRMLPLPPPARNSQLHIHAWSVISQFKTNVCKHFVVTFFSRISQGIEFLKHVLYERYLSVLASRLIAKSEIYV